MMTDQVSIWQPLSVRSFRYIWWSSVSSNFGIVIHTVAVGWLMATLTQSEQLVSLVQTAGGLPIMLLSLMSGAIADSYDRLRVVFWSHIVLVLSVVGLITFILTGFLNPTSLLILTFMFGVGLALFIPAWQAATINLLPRSQMTQGITLNSLSVNTMRGFVPALAGALVAYTGSFIVFSISLLACLPMIFVTIMLRTNGQRFRERTKDRLFAMMLEGLNFSRNSNDHRSVIIRSFLFTVCAGSVMALLPIIARDILGGNSITFGLLLTSFGIGSIFGAVTSGFVRRRFTNEFIARTIVGLFAAALLVIAFTQNFLIIFLALGIAGACWLMMLTTLNSVVQMLAPEALMARLLSIYHISNFGGVAIGALVWGSLAFWFSPQFSIAASACCLILNFGFGLHSPLKAFIGPTSLEIVTLSDEI